MWTQQWKLSGGTRSQWTNSNESKICIFVSWKPKVTFRLKFSSSPLFRSQTAYILKSFKMKKALLFLKFDFVNLQNGHPYWLAAQKILSTDLLNSVWTLCYSVNAWKRRLCWMKFEEKVGRRRSLEKKFGKRSLEKEVWRSLKKSDENDWPSIVC